MSDTGSDRTRRTVLRQAGLAAAGLTGLGAAGTAAAVGVDVGDEVYVRGDVSNVEVMDSCNSMDGWEKVDEVDSGYTGEVVNTSGSWMCVKEVEVDWHLDIAERGWVDGSTVEEHHGYSPSGGQTPP